MTWQLRLWAAQDAILAAISAQAALDLGGADEVGLDLGLPVDLRPEHVWVDGGASGTLTSELSGADEDGGSSPSGETFELKVGVFVATSPDYLEVRARVQELSAAVIAALSSPGVAAAVDSWSVSRYELASGTDGSNRLLALELAVACQCW